VPAVIRQTVGDASGFDYSTTKKQVKMVGTEWFNVLPRQVWRRL